MRFWPFQKFEPEAPIDRLRAAAHETGDAFERELERSVAAAEGFFSLSSVPTHGIVDNHIDEYQSTLERLGSARTELCKLISDAQARLLKVELAMEAATGALSILQAGHKDATGGPAPDPNATNTEAAAQVRTAQPFPVQGLSTEDFIQPPATAMGQLSPVDMLAVSATPAGSPSPVVRNRKGAA